MIMSFKEVEIIIREILAIHIFQYTVFDWLEFT